MTKQTRIESPVGFLTAGKLKIIACISMFIDHFGLMIFPSVYAFRAIGRLAFPVFAYFIAEGCHYSKRRVRRFLLLFAFGAGYLLFYYLFAGELYASIFLTFSGSVLLIYTFDFAKKYALTDTKPYKVILALLMAAASLGAAYLLCKLIEVDYGFFGMLTPLFVSLFDFKDLRVNKVLGALDTWYVRLVMLTLSLLLVYMKAPIWTANIFGLNIPHFCFAFFAPLLLIFYNGKVGNKKLKYGFYIFYPLHLAVIALIAMIISIVNGGIL